MRLVIFCHSIRSDWNHGNAHFLRGICVELQKRGHRVDAYEPHDGWSASQLAATEGAAALDAYRDTYPTLSPIVYDRSTLDLAAVVDDADLVLVHEWNEPALVADLGRLRAAGGRFRLLFHDTHHRSLSAEQEIAGLDLSAYDGVLAFGEVIRQRYQKRGWADRVWTWHEAADTSVFQPLASDEPPDDLVWIGNWGDGERSAELATFLIDPARTLGLTGHIYGVRYPDAALESIAGTSLRYGGRAANHEAPQIFARHRLTVHVPRRPYVAELPGIPTIRVFEALACGIPLVSAPWDDAEGLFTIGEDFLMAEDGATMTRHLQTLLADPPQARALAAHGLETVRARHTCAHRVDELLTIAASLGLTTDAREVA